jgi:ankyrin repeat protein
MKLLLTTIAAMVLVGCGPSVDIWEAAKEGNIESVKQYLDAGGDVDAKDKYEWTALRWAAAGGQNEIVELLIAKGADVNAKDYRVRRTPLHSAAAHGHKEVAKLLIINGADVNAKGLNPLIETQSGTPLHQAARNGQKEVIELLITSGADVNAKTKNGFTPLDVSSESGTAGYLREQGAKSGAEFSIHIASQLGDIEAVKRHIGSGIDVNTKIDTAEWTALHKAALKGQLETAKLLIKEGADVNAKAWTSGYGWGATPLDIIFSDGARNSAAMSGKSERYSKTADLLRKHGGKTGEELKAEGK